MKTIKSIIFLAMLTLSLSVSTPTFAQTKNAVKTTLITKQSQAKPTAYTYTAKDGTRYRVMQGTKGGYYVERKSQKTGKEYKMYLKPDQFDQNKKKK